MCFNPSLFNEKCPVVIYTVCCLLPKPNVDKIKRLAATEDRQEETRLPNEERYVDKGLTGTSVQLKERVINHHEAPGKYQLQKSFYPSYAVVSSFF